MEEETRKPRLTKRVRDRLRRLLPMEYKPAEIATILGITKDTLYRGWIPAGAPHRRDESGTIWFVGTDLAAWLRSQQRVSMPLQPGEAFCMRCKRAVLMAGPLERQPAQYAHLVRGHCPQCGARITRFEGHDPSAELD